MNMPDGNSAAELQNDLRVIKREQYVDDAEKKRAERVDDYIADESKQHKHALQEHLTELVAGNPLFLAAVQSIVAAIPRRTGSELWPHRNRSHILTAAGEIAQLFRAHIDKHEGDDLIQREADALENDTPCRCRGDCCC